MIVRDAGPADTAAIHRLIGQLADAPDEAEFRTRFERVAGSDGHRIIVAELDGRVAGVLHVFARPALEKPYEAVVQALVVDSEARSGGVGDALMREAEAGPCAAIFRRPRSTAASTARGRTPSTSASAIA
jgi:N-acetylglutamate synthase-like GNAT family acetyltransferase